MNPFRPSLSVRETKISDKIVVCADGMLGHTEMVLPMSREQFTECFTRWESGEMVQRAFPTLSPAQREFLLTGMSLDDQEEVFYED